MKAQELSVECLERLEKLHGLRAKFIVVVLCDGDCGVCTSPMDGEEAAGVLRIVTEELLNG